jgi:hypothetical protein
MKDQGGRNPALCKPIIPCNRRQYLCCAGKIDVVSSRIAISRDAKPIKHTATYGATEMVIAVRPYGVLKPSKPCTTVPPNMLFSTGHVTILPTCVT